MKRLRADRRVGILLGGVVLASFVALGASVALPASDPELQADTAERSTLEGRGMDVFRSEGCWYCHTQYRRETLVDAELGDARDPASYAGDSPVMLGHERIGPDLSQAGRFADARALIAYLRDPGAERNYRTSMPAYSYLSSDDLRALAAYLLSLR